MQGASAPFLTVSPSYWAAAPSLLLPVLAALLRLTVPARCRVTKQHHRNLGSIGPNKSGQSLLPMVSPVNVPVGKMPLGPAPLHTGPGYQALQRPSTATKRPSTATAFQVAHVKPEAARPDRSPSRQLAKGPRAATRRIEGGRRAAPPRPRRPTPPPRYRPPPLFRPP